MPLVYHIEDVQEQHHPYVDKRLSRVSDSSFSSVLVVRMTSIVVLMTTIIDITTVIIIIIVDFDFGSIIVLISFIFDQGVDEQSVTELLEYYAACTPSASAITTHRFLHFPVRETAVVVVSTTLLLRSCSRVMMVVVL